MTTATSPATASPLRSTGSQSDPIVDVSSTSKFTVPACLPTASGLLYRQRAGLRHFSRRRPDQRSPISGRFTVVYIQEEDGFAFFFEPWATALPAFTRSGFSYGGVTVPNPVQRGSGSQPTAGRHHARQPDLPAACLHQPDSGALRHHHTDDCDPVISTNPSRLSFTYNNGSGTVALNPRRALPVQGCSEFERMLTP